jgi:hypothetical protein
MSTKDRRPGELELASALQLALDVIEESGANADFRAEVARVVLAAFAGPPTSQPAAPSAEPSSSSACSPPDVESGPHP